MLLKPNAIQIIMWYKWLAWLLSTGRQWWSTNPFWYKHYYYYYYHTLYRFIFISDFVNNSNTDKLESKCLWLCHAGAAFLILFYCIPDLFLKVFWSWCQLCENQCISYIWQHFKFLVIRYKARDFDFAIYFLAEKLKLLTK